MAATQRSPSVASRFYWSHVRREFYALAYNSPVATEILCRIAMLYGIEDEVRGTLAEQRRAACVERSLVIMDDLKSYRTPSVSAALAERR